MKRKILVKLGRGGEALDAAWADYREHPDTYRYHELMQFVPEGKQLQWHARAMEETREGGLRSLIELFIEVGEIDLLATRVGESRDLALEGLSHLIAEPAARKLEKAHPAVAARLWRGQGLRIINARKSKYYDAAIAHFRSAKRCFVAAGLTAEWEDTVSVIRADHRRKTGFMSEFERLTAGLEETKEPSFLERAKERWEKRTRGEGK